MGQTLTWETVGGKEVGAGDTDWAHDVSHVFEGAFGAVRRLSFLHAVAWLCLLADSTSLRLEVFHSGKTAALAMRCCPPSVTEQACDSTAGLAARRKNILHPGLTTLFAVFWATSGEGKRWILFAAETFWVDNIDHPRVFAFLAVTCKSGQRFSKRWAFEIAALTQFWFCHFWHCN